MYALIVLYALISFNQVLNTQTQTECIDGARRSARESMGMMRVQFGNAEIMIE